MFTTPPMSLSATSTHLLNTARDGDSNTVLANLCQCLTISLAANIQEELEYDQFEKKIIITLIKYLQLKCYL